MAKFLNRVRINIGTTGQGVVTCGSAYATSYLTMAEAGAIDGAIYSYVLSEGNNFELGWGVYSSSDNTLTRNVYISKIAGVVGTTKMTLAGNAVLNIDVLAQDLTSPALTLVDRKIASNVSSIDFTGLSAANYDAFVVILDSVQPVTNSVDLYMRLSFGSGFLSGAGQYRWHNQKISTSAATINGNDGDTQMIVSASALGNGTDLMYSQRITIFGPGVTSQKKRANWEFAQIDASGNTFFGNGGGMFIGGNASIDGIRFLMSSGNISIGTFSLYGMKNA